MSGPVVSIVVAVGRNGVIGADNDMPWRLSSDLRRFKAITLGKPVVMGRRTLESIGRPLPGRANIVLSRDPDWRADGVTAVHSLADALAEARRIADATGADEIMVVGGGQVYAEALPNVGRVHLTRVDLAPSGDTVFPLLDPNLWVLTAEEPMPRTERDEADAVWQTWERRTGDAP